MGDTGESTASMNKRADQQQWERYIEPYMQRGALLVKHSWGMYYTQLGDEFGRYGLSATGVRNLEKEGKIKLVGVHKYALAGAA